MGGSAIDAVEAIYAGIETAAPHAWLAQILPSVTACAGGTRGALAHTYRLVGPAAEWRISRPVVHDAPAELADVVTESFSRSPPEFLERCYRDIGPAGTFSSLTGLELTDLPSNGRDAGRLGVRDQIYINAADANGNGLVCVINMAARHQIRAAEKRRLGMIAAHATAALRILLHFARGEPTPAAVFDPGGKDLHVEAAHEGALASLRTRVKRIDRARGKVARADPDGALVSWDALLAGRYSLVDRFESDGRRFVVAYANEPHVVDPRGLTRAEAVVAAWAVRGHSEKLIAYELGVAAGTVSGLLARVYRKLGLRTRSQLVRFLRVPTELERMPLEEGGDILVFSAPEVTMPDLAFARLTEAERDVARAAARGERNAEIARRRRVSEGTIAKQLTRIYDKLGIGSRAALARLVAR